MNWNNLFSPPANPGSNRISESDLDLYLRDVDIPGASTPCNYPSIKVLNITPAEKTNRESIQETTANTKRNFTLPNIASFSSIFSSVPIQWPKITLFSASKSSPEEQKAKVDAAIKQAEEIGVNITFNDNNKIGSTNTPSDSRWVQFKKIIYGKGYAKNYDDFKKLRECIKEDYGFNDGMPDETRLKDIFNTESMQKFLTSGVGSEVYADIISEANKKFVLKNVRESECTKSFYTINDDMNEIKKSHDKICKNFVNIPEDARPFQILKATKEAFAKAGEVIAKAEKEREEAFAGINKKPISNMDKVFYKGYYYLEKKYKIAKELSIYKKEIGELNEKAMADVLESFNHELTFINQYISELNKYVECERMISDPSRKTLLQEAGNNLTSSEQECQKAILALEAVVTAENNSGTARQAKDAAVAKMLDAKELVKKISEENILMDNQLEKLKKMSLVNLVNLFHTLEFYPSDNLLWPNNLDESAKTTYDNMTKGLSIPKTTSTEIPPQDKKNSDSIFASMKSMLSPPSSQKKMNTADLFELLILKQFKNSIECTVPSKCSKKLEGIIKDKLNLICESVEKREEKITNVRSKEGREDLSLFIHIIQTDFEKFCISKIFDVTAEDEKNIPEAEVLQNKLPKAEARLSEMTPVAISV